MTLKQRRTEILTRIAAINDNGRNDRIELAETMQLWDELLDIQLKINKQRSKV